MGSRRLDEPRYRKVVSVHCSDVALKKKENDVTRKFAECKMVFVVFAARSNVIKFEISMLHAMLRAATSQGFETNLDHIRINDVLEAIL